MTAKDLVLFFHGDPVEGMGEVSVALNTQCLGVLPSRTKTPLATAALQFAARSSLACTECQAAQTEARCRGGVLIQTSLHTPNK